MPTRAPPPLVQPAGKRRRGAARSRRARPRKGAGDPWALPPGLGGGGRGLSGQRRPCRGPAGEGGGARAGQGRGSPAAPRARPAAAGAGGSALSCGGARGFLGFSGAAAGRGRKDVVQEVQLSCVFGFSWQAFSFEGRRACLLLNASGHDRLNRVRII